MRRAMIAALALAAAAPLAATASATSTASASPRARAARSCPTPPYPGDGYFTSLSVSNTSCGSGSKLAVAYYRCRTRHGKAGRCTSRVLGYRCSEVRHSIPTEIVARVTCTNGRARVIHTYQQNV
jgi:hypothetical protein